MNVRFEMINKSEVAILRRKDYEALAAKAQEADEDVGTARPPVPAKYAHRHSDGAPQRIAPVGFDFSK